MMDFDTAVALLVSPMVEGGYANNRLDPGGPTRWGITQKTAAAHGYKGDMRFLPLELAKQIYLADYWSPQLIDQLPEPLRYPMFDCCVNEGVQRGIEFLNECLAMSEDKVDEATTVAASLADPWMLTCEFMAKRVRHYTSLPTWGGYGRGWMNRIATNLEILANLKGHA